MEVIGISTMVQSGPSRRRSISRCTPGRSSSGTSLTRQISSDTLSIDGGMSLEASSSEGRLESQKSRKSLTRRSSLSQLPHAVFRGMSQRNFNNNDTPEVVTERRPFGPRRGSVSGGRRRLLRSTSCEEPLESFVGKDPERRRVGFRRTHSIRLPEGMVVAGMDMSESSTSQCSSASPSSASTGSGKNRRAQMRRASLDSTWHHTPRPGMRRYDSTSNTLSKNNLAALEAESLLEQVQQAIREKKSRQEQLKTLIQSDALVAKARYESKNDRGSLLLLRRIHKYTYQMQRVESAYRRLVDVQNRLKTTIKSPEDAKHFDASLFQGVLASALSLAEDNGHSMPTDEELRSELDKLGALERRSNGK